MDEAGHVLTTNTKAGGRYHSNWLSMIYPRLRLAKNLLSEDGIVFISIDDNEIFNLRILLDELFGNENYVGTIVWKGATDNNPTQIAVEHEYILCYAGNKGQIASAWKDRSADAKVAMLAEYKRLRDLLQGNIDAIQREFRRFIKANRESLQPITHYDRIDEEGPYTGGRKVHNPKPGGYFHDVIHPVTGKPCVPPANGYRYPKETMDELLQSGKILFGEDEGQIIQIKEYLSEYEAKLSSVIFLDSRAGANELRALFAEDGERIFPSPKPCALLKEIFGFVIDAGDVVLDFFAGSGSTAQAILELNHEDASHLRFVLVQLPEPTPRDSAARRAGFSTIADIGKERIRRVIARMQAEAPQPQLIPDRETPEDLGFRVFKLERSHFKAWQDYAGDDVAQLETLFDRFESPLAEGWQPDDLLVEVMLMQGFPLDSATTPLPGCPHNRVLRVASDLAAHDLYVCLDARLHPATLEALALRPEDVFVCLDSALDEETKLRLQDGRNVMVI